MRVAQDFQPLVQAIEQGRVDEGVAEAERLNAAGYKMVTIFQDAIVPCLRDIGDRFSRLELFLPEMMRAAEVVKAIHKSLDSRMEGPADGTRAGKVVIGTVYGDVHDIGKNIVASMLEVNGFEVHDLGVSVEAQEFLRRAGEVGANIIALSSLLTTSIPYMADTIELVRAMQSSRADRPRFKILVGGGPVTAEIAQKIGADAYGEDAVDAVRQAKALLQLA